MSYYYVIITVRIGRLENKRPLIVIVAHEGCIIANCGAGIPSVWLFLTPHIRVTWYRACPVAVLLLKCPLNATVAIYLA